MRKPAGARSDLDADARHLHELARDQRFARLGRDRSGQNNHVSSKIFLKFDNYFFCQIIFSSALTNAGMIISFR